MGERTQPPVRVGSLSRPDGIDIHYVSAGSGPTVLLAHGYLLDHHLYDGLLGPLLARGLRPVAFDQRGHGRSGIHAGQDDADVMADDYAALLVHLDDPEPVTLVAHSMGAFLALRACLRHRELFAQRVSRLVLLGGNAGNVAAGSVQNRLQIPLLRAGLLPPLWRVPALGRAMMRPLFGDLARPEHVEWARKTIAATDPRHSLPVLQAMAHDDLYPHLGEIPIETLALCGTRDGTCPPWHSERLGRDIPRARTLWLSGRGHMLPLEDPEAVLDAIPQTRRTRRTTGKTPARG